MNESFVADPFSGFLSPSMVAEHCEYSEDFHFITKSIQSPNLFWALVNLTEL